MRISSNLVYKPDKLEYFVRMLLVAPVLSAGWGVGASESGKMDDVDTPRGKQDGRKVFGQVMDDPGMAGTGFSLLL